MVFDFFNGGELYHYLSECGKFTEDRARFYTAEIIMALGYLHDKGIVYRDLKPENLILDAQGHIRVTDFGLSKEGVRGDSIISVCGTPEYLAPEIVRKQPYGAAVDWWALGTLLYEMIAGLPPFYDRNRPTMYTKILTQPLEFTADFSPEARDLIARMLEREPRQRIGYGGSHELKAHPFFRGFDWDRLLRKEVTPPWLPQVDSETDTSNIAKEFTSENPEVTPSPVGSRLRDLLGGGCEDLPEFTGERRGEGRPPAPHCLLPFLQLSHQPPSHPHLTCVPTAPRHTPPHCLPCRLYFHPGLHAGGAGAEGAGGV
jgi:serum/glucocorticoid-regulated kinase 2